MSRKVVEDGDTPDAPKTTVTIHLYDDITHNEEESVITRYITQTFPTKLTSFADVDDLHLIFYNSQILRCPSLQLMLHSMLPLTAFQVLAPILSRGKPGEVFTDRERLYICVSRSKESSMDKAFVYKIMEKIMVWAKKEMEPPKTLFYLANNSSKWNPDQFVPIFEGTGFTLMRHLISQKTGLYSPVDPGYPVTHGKGCIKSRTQPAKIRGEIYRDKPYSKARKAKRLHGFKVLDEPEGEESGAEDRQDERDSPQREATPSFIPVGSPIGASTPMPPRDRDVPDMANLPAAPALTQTQMSEIAKQVADLLQKQQTTSKGKMRRATKQPAEEQTKPPQEVDGKSKQKGKKEFLAAMAQSRASLINRQLPRQDGEGTSGVSRTATQKATPKPAPQKEHPPTEIYNLSTEHESSTDTSATSTTTSY